MKLKTITTADGKTYAEIQDGKPVYVHDDGKEVAFDAPQTVQTISRLNGEAKGHRERAEAAEAKNKVFEGIDPDKARKALETVGNLDAKKLVDAGEVEKVKAEAIKAVKAEFEPIVAERDKLVGELRQEKIGGSFARSKYIAEKLAIPADMVEATFGKHFEVKDGKIIAKGADGKEIYSRTRHGEIADFEEAIETIVSAYPHKDHILKGATNGGGGASSRGGTGGAGKTLTRQEFDSLPAADRPARMKDGFKVVDAAA